MDGYTIIKVFIIITAVILVALVGIVAYVLMASPASTPASVQAPTNSDQAATQSAIPIAPVQTFTVEQAEVLREAGVDPASVPPLTPEFQACLVARLGQERLRQISTTQQLTVEDVEAAKPCWQ